MVQVDVIVIEISTFQREKCLAMLLKEWTMFVSMRPSDSECTWIVGRALKYLEMLLAVP